jgi:hypothetical protein
MKESEMSRSGYSDDYGDDDPLALGRWRGAVKSAIRGRRGQAFLKEMLAALDALPQKRLIPNILQEAEWADDDETLVPVKNGDVCAFGAVGRARGIEMPAELDLDDDDPDDMAYEVQDIFGTSNALTREIMYVNDECGMGRRVPLPNIPYDKWSGFAWTYLPETPVERFARVRRWVTAQINTPIAEGDSPKGVNTNTSPAASSADKEGGA